MRHVDDETLSLLALGEVLPDGAVAVHLRECAQCQEELTALTSLVTAGRSGARLQAPPAYVWDRIAEEIAAEEVADDELTEAAQQIGRASCRERVSTIV